MKRKIICTFCGTVMRSVAQTKEECEDRPYSKRPHAVRPEDLKLLEKREQK